MTKKGIMSTLICLYLLLAPMSGSVGQACVRLSTEYHSLFIHPVKNECIRSGSHAGVGAIIIYMLAGGFIMFMITRYVNFKELKRIFSEYKRIRQQEKCRKATESREESHQLHNSQQAITVRELCAPLPYITGSLKELIKSGELPLPLLKQAQKAYYNSISIQDSYNQFLDFDKQDHHNPSMQVAPYPANKISDAVIHSFYGLLNSNPITLHYDKENKISTEIWIDRQRVEFILRNILSNACRHISYSGAVWYTITQTTIDDKEYCVFTISDDAKKRNKTDYGYTLVVNAENESMTESAPKTGFELMEKIVSRHHGKITITQTEEENTQVTLCIQLGKAHFDKDTNIIFVEPEEIMIEEEEEPQNEILPEKEINEGWTPKVMTTGKPKLLIIEDHKDIHLYLKVLFSHEYTLVMAENGEEGLRVARKELPDLIITDVMMPVMDGFECCKRLKEDLKTCHIPVILLTAMVSNEDVVKGIELGADDYILKPFNPEILRTKVRRLINSRSELKQIYTKLLMPLGNPMEDNAADVKEEKDPFIAQILQIVEENLQNPEFSVKKLSEMQNMSQPTLYRRVKQLTSFTIVELIRSVRLKRSAELLRTKQYNVQEVAEMVGYNDIPTFRKHFVDFYGTTPSTFSKDGTD